MKYPLPKSLLCNLPAHKSIKEIPQAFSDSTHRLWCLQNPNKPDLNYILKMCSNTQSPFWQIMQDLFDYDLKAEIAYFSDTYDFIGQTCDIKIPSLLRAEVNNDFSYVLTTELEGKACGSNINDHMIRQLARHLAQLHDKNCQQWGRLQKPQFKAKDWSRCLKITLERSSKKWGGVFLQSDMYLKQALDACDAINSSEFVPLIPDLRWDQFLQKDNEISGFVDLDAFVYAPRELDFIILEYILSKHQFDIFNSVYSEYHSIPDIALARPAYRLLLFYMQILGEVDLEDWIKKEYYF